jgi:hypothetical protein
MYDGIRHEDHEIQLINLIWVVPAETDVNYVKKI